MEKEKVKRMQRIVYMSEDDYNYLKRERLPISATFRQAVRALKEGKWKFDPFYDKI